MAKVIITETQYYMLEKLLLETRFDVMLKKTAKVGDIIRISYKNTVNNFKIIQNVDGQIIMDNVDAGSTNHNYRYFLSVTSLSNDTLEIRRVHKIKEKNKLRDIKSWTKLDVKDIINIEIVRNDKVIDTVDTIIPTDKKAKKTKPTKTPDTEDFNQRAGDLLLNVVNVKAGQGLSFNMADGSKIKFCVDASQSYKYSLSLGDKSSYEPLNDWDTFAYEIKYSGGDDPEEDIYEQNKNLVTSTDDGKTFNFRIKGFSGERSKDIMINNINDISVMPQCEGEESEEDSETKKNIKKKLKDEAKLAYDAILNDPKLKQAFYKQPSLWNLFVAELTGKKATGKGIVPTLNLVGQYKRKKIDAKLGSEFKTNKTVQFMVLDKPVQIVYLDKSSTSKTFQLDAGKPYEIKVRDYKIGDEYKVLYSGLDSYKILVKEKTEDANIFVCDVVKLVKLSNETKQYIKKDVKIKFLPSEGYRSTKIKTK